MTKLNTVKEIQEHALKLGITLSYKDEDGKRKRYTKPQLLEMIEVKENENYINKDTQLSVEYFEKLQTSTIYGKKVSSVHMEEVSEVEQKTDLKTIVNEVRSLLKDNKIQDAVKKVEKLNNEIRNERKNKLLISTMSQRLNVLKALLKSKKVGVKLV